MKYLKAITAKQARKINLKNGFDWRMWDGVRTYWATDDEETCTWSFESPAKRDEFVRKYNEKNK